MDAGYRYVIIRQPEVEGWVGCWNERAAHRGCKEVIDFWYVWIQVIPLSLREFLTVIHPFLLPSIPYLYCSSFVSAPYPVFDLGLPDGGPEILCTDLRLDFRDRGV